MAIWLEVAWLLTRKTRMRDPIHLLPKAHLYDLV